jgi:hypothetical protein
MIEGDCKDGENNQRLAEIGGEDKVLPAFIFGKCEARTNHLNLDENPDLRVYPNPARDLLYIESDSRDVLRIRLLDITGSLVKEVLADHTGRQALDVGEMKEGLYLLILDGEGHRMVSKITINR